MSNESAFDYLTVLISIILGLAITNVLARLASVMTARERVDFYWPPIAWAIWLFFISIQHWWAEWSARLNSAQWTFGAFVLVLLTPVDLFLLSALVLPDREENGKMDLGVWYARNYKWFFGLLALLPALSVAEELSRSGFIRSYTNLAFLGAYEIVCIIAFFVRDRRAQEWITGQAMVMTVFYIVLLFLYMK